jgi:hypothetical protein
LGKKKNWWMDIFFLQEWATCHENVLKGMIEYTSKRNFSNFFSVAQELQFGGTEF